MFYLVIYIIFAPFLLFFKVLKPCSKGKVLVIQTAKIGDYANSSIIFEPLGSLDIVIDGVNLAFSKYDERIKKIYVINEYKKGIFSKIKLAFMLYGARYERIYVLLPNSLNLFLARFAMPSDGVVAVAPSNARFSTKILSVGFKKVRHSTNDLTLLTYLKMLGITELGYKKQIQKPVFVPSKSQIINSDKIKVGISFSAANKIKTPPAKTWQAIFDLLKKFNPDIYIFGVRGDDDMLKNLDTSGLSVVSVVDKIELCFLPAEIAKMDFYISSDTGNYYIADTMGVSSVVLMGPCFASEQRGVGDTLIITSLLAPFTSVFATVRDMVCDEYYELSSDDLVRIESFICKKFR